MWIEMKIPLICIYRKGKSSPVWGMWIEIVLHEIYRPEQQGHPPTGDVDWSLPAFAFGNRRLFAVNTNEILKTK